LAAWEDTKEYKPPFPSSKRKVPSQPGMWDGRRRWILSFMREEDNWSVIRKVSKIPSRASRAFFQGNTKKKTSCNEQVQRNPDIDVGKEFHYGVQKIAMRSVQEKEQGMVQFNY
jgi:hypothetical protein